MRADGWRPRGQILQAWSMTDELRFLCDEMLVGLGRWLRIAGCDTAIAERGRRDRDLATIVGTARSISIRCQRACSPSGLFPTDSPATAAAAAPLDVVGASTITRRGSNLMP